MADIPIPLGEAIRIHMEANRKDPKQVMTDLTFVIGFLAGANLPGSAASVALCWEKLFPNNRCPILDYLD